MNGLLGDLPEFQNEMSGMSLLNANIPEPQKRQPTDLSFLEKMAIVLAPTAYSNIQNVRNQRQQQQAGQQQQARIQQAIQGNPSDYAQAAATLFQQGDIEGGNRLLGIAKQVRDMRDKLVERRLGDRVALTTEYDPNVVGQFGIGISPDSQLSSDTTRRGQDISAATARRGQDISAANAAAKSSYEANERRALNPTETKIFSETEESLSNAGNVIETLARALEINEDAYSGPGALSRAKIRSAVPGFDDSDAANKTIELDNLIGTQALQSLRSIFGGNPTEGERKILIDLQASVTKTPEQRKVILQRAKEAAEKRLASSSRKLEAIATGTYGTQEYLQPQQSVKRFNPETGRIE